MLIFATAIGDCGLRWGSSGVTRVVLPGDPALARTRGDDLAAAPEPVRAAVRGIVALLDGEPRDLRDVRLDESALQPFPRHVYAATRAIDPGTVATYGEIARAVGDPGAARAVGAALGANPYPVIVPCHRVLAADGALHGFSAPGGIATKRRMLELEGAPGFAQRTLFA
ncbi:MAG: methylated-DNA--[protein]-cysteine S-methyltransferase [Actinomycetota bacterium]|nr:methylated-DNA--[protein]-cysteine S-methyltransferase [Actinomycetota bacterium]